MRSLDRYLAALLMCLVFCQGLMGAEKREMIEVTEGNVYNRLKEKKITYESILRMARKDASGKKKWGFMSMTGRIMVPCR